MIEVFIGLRVLNIGSGLLPLVVSDFDGIEKIINFDTLDSLRKKGITTALLFKKIIGSFDDVFYDHVESQVDKICRDGDIDYVFSISPFGFSVVNKWVNRKLAVGGVVVVARNKSNRWIRETNVFEGDIMRCCRHAEIGDKYFLYRAYGKIEKGYLSYTSAAEKQTKFDRVQAYKKIH